MTNPYESPPEVEDAPRQPSIRSIAGWILIGLGLLLPLRTAWLAWWWWPLAEVERNRVIALSVIGMMLALIGGWLRFRSILFLVPLAILLVIGCLIAVLVS